MESNNRPFFEEAFGFLPLPGAAGGAVGGAVSLFRFFPNFFLFEVGGSDVVAVVVVVVVAEVEVSWEGVSVGGRVEELMRGAIYDNNAPEMIDKQFNRQ